MNVDFIVVGAGMAGVSIAYELSKTRRVCLIEGEKTPGYHATGRSAALFAPSYGGAVIRAVTRASRLFFDNPPNIFAGQPLMRARGCLYIARADQYLRLLEMKREIEESGGRVELMDSRQALGYVSALRSDYVSHAAFDDDAMDIDVHSLHQGFIKGARANGAPLLANCWINAVDYRAGLWRLKVNDQIISAPILVNAAGAWADELARACGAKPLGLEPLRRTALLVDPPGTGTIAGWPAVIDADEQFYFKPEAGQLLLSPADETPCQPMDVYADEWNIAVAIDRVQSALHLDVKQVRHSWAGLRTFAPDRVPVVGFDSSIKGFFWCAGQGGYGIQTAPALSRIAASLALEISLPADIAQYGLDCNDLAPSRFDFDSSAEKCEL